MGQQGGERKQQGLEKAHGQIEIVVVTVCQKATRASLSPHNLSAHDLARLALHLNAHRSAANRAILNHGMITLRRIHGDREGFTAVGTLDFCIDGKVHGIMQ
jgi:hypothetical protein